MKVEIRASEMSDAIDIFELRRRPELRDMQYTPSRFEPPTAYLEMANPDDDTPALGYKFATIVVDGDFAGHISQQFSMDVSGGHHCSLGWNIKPELWGQGIMVKALNALFSQRFAESATTKFTACCFANNSRNLRVFHKVGFRQIKPLVSERLSNFVQTFGRHKLLKFGLTYDDWKHGERPTAG